MMTRGFIADCRSVVTLERLVAAFAVIGSALACSSSSVHVSSTCPMSFSHGIPGVDAGIAGPIEYSCEPLPKQCTSNPTCDCIACNSACQACTSQGNGQYSDGGGGGATCSYDSALGTFTVECINA